MEKLKVIIYGLGNIVNQHLPFIDMDTVLAFSDNDEKKHNSYFCGKQVIQPNKIKNYEYKYVVIFVNNYVDEIYQQFIDELGIDSSKIIHWKYFLFLTTSDRKFLSIDVMEGVLEVVNTLESKKILDVHTAFERFNIFTKNFMGRFNIEEVSIDAYRSMGKPLFPIYCNIYSNVYDLNLCSNEYYDVILMVDLYLLIGINECLELLDKTHNLSKYTILTIPTFSVNENQKWLPNIFEQYGTVNIIEKKGFKILVIEKKKKITLKELDIYVVTHKKFNPPNNEVYIPIHAGRIQNNNNLGFQGDDIGDNISNLNLLINECTALYWMWKHSECKYIGLNHYRRYLLKNTNRKDIDNIVDKSFAEEILEDFDMILGYAIYTFPNNVMEHLRVSVCEEAFFTGTSLIRDIIAKKHSDYLAAYDELFLGYAFFPCNMFITKKEIMDQYCEWLFDIIIEASYTIDVSNYDSYSKRIIGFIAERLFSVWIIKNNFKIKELPILELQ